MQIMICPTGEEVNQTGASIIADLIRNRPKAVLGLATGGTPVGIYKELVGRHRNNLLSFNGVTTFNLDEYAGLPSSHPQSYHYYMNEHLFGHIDLPAKQIHIPNGSALHLEEECLMYDRQLEAAGQMDLQLLGLGHNGHIGFNEPDHELIAKTHIVELKEDTRHANARFFGPGEKVPTHAITMGVGSILKAKQILLVVKGADKADIVKRALYGPITTACPASLLQTHPNLIVLLDSGAGRLISE